MRRIAPPARLPRVNSPVHVSGPDLLSDLPSRVEDHVGGLLVVAAVPVPGLRDLTGSRVTVTWAEPPRGVRSMSCELVEHRRGVPPLWLLQPVGEPRTLQRRRYARADVCGRSVVRAVDDGPVRAGQQGADPDRLDAPAGPGQPWSASGLLADLSEGGARIVLDPRQQVPGTAGEQVELDLALPDGTLRTGAELVAVDALASDRQQVRLSFDLPEREADRVRRAVLQRQLEARARGDLR